VRVTDRSIFESGRANIAAASARAQDAQRIASTGLRVESPGDDAAAAGSLAAAPVAEARYRAIGAAANAASGELQSADQALSGVASALSRAQELAVQLSNGTYSAAQRTSGAAEVDGLMKDVVLQLNTQVGGRYLFGGVSDSAPPFTAAGAYQGSAQQRTIEVAPGVLQASSIRADAAMGADGSGVDVLATLGALRDALASNDPAGVAATLDALGTSVEQVGSARAEGGVAMNALDTSAAASAVAADDVKTRASNLSDADYVDAATQLAFSQRALEASYAATAQGFKLSLLDYLR
jgi:flagellin-like hook-associated protein FlgL